MEPRHLENYFFFGMLVAVLALAVAIFLPYFSSLVLAVVFAVVFYPLYERIRRLFGGYDSIAAALTVVIVILIVFLPVSYFGYQIFDEATALYWRIPGVAGGADRALEASVIGQYAERFGVRIGTDEIAMYARQFLGWLIPNLGAALSGVASALGVIGLSLIGIFYFLRDGARLEERIAGIVPLTPPHTRQIVDALRVTVNSVVRGALVVAGVQGFLSGVGLWLFGVPSPVLWGSLAVLAALVPMVGVALVFAPSALYLLLTGHVAAMVGLVLWGVLLVGTIDNFLRPYLIERTVKVHPFVILLSVLGGIGLFGPIGFLVGPLVVSLLVTLLEMTRSMLDRTA